MKKSTLSNVTKELKTKYPEVGIQKIEVDDQSGKSTFYLQPTNKVLASLPQEKAVQLRPSRDSYERAATITRDALDRSFLDLVGPSSPSELDAHEIFNRANKYYFEQGVYGAHIDILTNLASKGFENDIDDDKIKAFYDTWNFDVDFRRLLDWIFFDFFRIGMVRTYKIIGKYEPGISYMSPIPGMKKSRGLLKEISERAARIHKKRMEKWEKEWASLDGRKKDEKGRKEELAAKKKVWSKGFMPVAYTVLNPSLVEIEGSLLFDKTKVVLNPSDELKKLLQKSTSEMTDDEKLIVKLLPSDFKSAVEAGGGIELDPMFVGAIDYRKQPYERYPKPRGIKVFDSLEYKRALKQADLSTLDGITNYILKITVGNDEYPVTDQTQLETVAQLFNTPSKSFDVVWNHTLQVEKIVSPEIGEVLGQDKYEQVNEDISGGIAMSRALIDGITNVNQGEAALIVKSVIEEINYARRQVTQWIYHEYQQIAEAAGFDRFPRVRWDNTVLKDIILYMATISQLVDRRMLSYQTALEQLGFDYDNEFNNMENEFPAVLKGVLGVVGSPFQQSKDGPNPPSSRPTGKVSKKKQPDTTQKNKKKVPNQSPSNQPGPSPQAASISKDKVEMVLDFAFNNFENEDLANFVKGFIEGIYGQ